MEFLAHSAIAKDGIKEQSYKDHISEVLRMADENTARIACYAKYADLLRSIVKSSALFHDLGKLDIKNQDTLKGGNKNRLPINHADGGVAHLLSMQKVSTTSYLAALIISAHHRGLPSIPEELAKGEGKYFRDEKLLSFTDNMVKEYFKYHLLSSIGAATVPDIHWNGAVSPQLMRIALSCLVDADHTDTSRHYKKAVPEGEIPLHPEKRLELLDRYVENLSVKNSDKNRTVLRKRVYSVCRQANADSFGIIACDSPTGTGKTTAVMAHLLSVAKERGLRRIFVVLPFTNIINQSVDVYRKALVIDGEIVNKVVAAHHHRAEFEDEETRAFSFLWNAPITVTTAVQFFETLSSNHPSTLRKMHQLPGSAIFLDEAHAALPAHLWPQAWKWLKELVEDWGCYVVMASGSLTRFWELEEFSYPVNELKELVTNEVREEAQRAESIRINYKPKVEPMGIEELRDWIQTLAGPRLVIMNTVQSAASLAKQLAGQNNLNRNKVEHLSTALAPKHRAQTIIKVNLRLNDKNDDDWTLVATSCVEAGMDFSFRTAAREFCSLVSTIQTAGRINRSGEFQESDLWNFKIKNDGFLKEHPQFVRSATILEEMFAMKQVAPEHCKEAMKREVRQNNQGNSEEDPIVQAERNREFPEVDRKFKVIDNDTRTVLIDKNICARIEAGENIMPSEFQDYSVNIYSSQIDKYGVMPLNNYPFLYQWTLEYDDFIGYMAGVLKLSGYLKGGFII